MYVADHIHLFGYHARKQCLSAAPIFIARRIWKRTNCHAISITEITLSCNCIPHSVAAGVKMLV